MYARASITGMTRGTKREHIIRAAEESIAYQSADVAAAMVKDAGAPLHSFKVDGGATRDDFLMQFQADVLGQTVLRPKVRETTALGAAYLAGLAVGFWRDREELAAMWQVESRFEPSIDSAKRDEMMAGWHKAVAMTTYQA